MMNSGGRSEKVDVVKHLIEPDLPHGKPHTVSKKIIGVSHLYGN